MTSELHVEGGDSLGLLLLQIEEPNGTFRFVVGSRKLQSVTRLEVRTLPNAINHSIIMMTQFLRISRIKLK